MRLFEINNAILECIDLETGEITDIEKLEGLQMDRREKLANIALLYKNMISDAKQLSDLEKEYKARRQSAEKTAEWAKQTLARELNGEKMDDEKKRFRISWRPSTSTKVDMNVLPDEWKKVEVKPMTKEIGEAIKAGQEIPGAWQEVNNNIQIK